MSNSYNISVAPQIAGVRAVVDAIRAVDVVALAGEHADLGVVVDAIRATDVPTITTAITTAEGNMRGADSDTLKTISDQIDGLGVARGTTKRGSYSSTDVNWTQKLSIAGRGKLLYGYLSKGSPFDASQNFVKITIDGTAYEVPSSDIVVDTEHAIAYQDRITVNIFDKDLNLNENVRLLNYEFKTSLLIEMRRPEIGGGGAGLFTLFYIED